MRWRRAGRSQAPAPPLGEASDKTDVEKKVRKCAGHGVAWLELCYLWRRFCSRCGVAQAVANGCTECCRMHHWTWEQKLL